MRFGAPTDKFEFYPWFAWHPVRIQGRIVWLETVLRSRYYSWMHDAVRTTYILPLKGDPHPND